MLEPSSITYILAVAGWLSLAKQGPFNMIRTDYGVVCTSKEPRPIITPAFQHDSRSSSSLPSNVERKREKTEPRRLLMDGFIIHSGLSCTVSGSDGAQLPALWLVLKIDWASELIIVVPEACTNRFMWLRTWHALRRFKEHETKKTGIPHPQVMNENICLSVFPGCKFSFPKLIKLCE